MQVVSSARALGPAPLGAVYRAVWRWHFYAGLLVIPFLILLAVTGGLYLFHKEIDAVVHANLLRVQPGTGPGLAPSALVANAQRAVPGTPLTYVTPGDPGAAAAVGIRTPEGTHRLVYLDPADGRVLGSIGPKSTVMGIVRQLHSLAFFGVWPPYVIEIVGGWTVVLVLTGLYLWWPRGGRKGGVVSLRGTPTKRIFWRDLHAVSGLLAAIFLAFLAVTGMPWSSFWGGQTHRLVAAAGIGFPAGAWGDAPSSSLPLQAVAADVGWTMQTSPVPLSSGHHQGAPTKEGTPADLPTSIGLDAAVAIFNEAGLERGYAVALPQTAEGVYSGTVYPADLAKERAIHLDQYTGRKLIDVAFADYGWGGKAIEWGVNVHMGQEFGRLNQIVLALACVLVIVMAVGALVMWWKRRPPGSLAAPPWPSDRRPVVAVTAILFVLGLVYPLTGISMLAILAVDLIGHHMLAARAASAA
ncbi:Uncharacterized iron-regulated membrane protein [Arboricoccus pini]|uniref:Uncharacterized iron-regulated membrane protein n=1 Tax=Arboricoccus pini TaxID=1963835 RepID=A0A212RXD3_9PROT|nr:PepSY domain-containing protein [Arboricoccus pini]SNB77283.1 Uncharacterized iron-regulated membrane protein [Arboricoccus pini]